MTAKKILIIGGVAAGPSAAAKARRTDEEAEITLLERGEIISYSGCGLPFYVGGQVRNRQDLVVMTPESFKARHNVEVLIRHEARKIDPLRKEVTVYDETLEKSRVFSYDSLVIATGAKPIFPPIPGIDLPHVFKLRTIPDADAILACATKCAGGNAVIVGGGLIGLEMAESLNAKGLQVTVVEKEEQILAPFDFEMAFLVEKLLRSKGVRVIKGDGISSFAGDPGGVKEAVLESGIRIPADMVLMSIGVKPEVGLAVEAGIQLGRTGAIAVDSFMATNSPGVYAAGDCAESFHILRNEPVWTPLGSVANRQGRVAGENAAGGNSEFKGVLGGSVTKIFDMTAARTGLNEKEAKICGFDYLAVHLHPLNRAHICPSAEELSMKLVVERNTERLLGAQIVGGEGADKRIDVFTTVIHANLKASELFDIDYAYSPPYAPAKDPAGIGGLVAENAMRSGVDFVSPQWLKDNYSRVGKDIFLVDVREPHEIKEHGKLKGAVNIPLDTLRNRVQELRKEGDIVLYCRQGLRGYLAGRTLVNKGFTGIKNLSGGILMWPYEDMITGENAEKK